MKLDRTGKNVLFIVLEGIAAVTVLNLYNPFLQMFAKRLGANDLHIALVNSLPPLVAIFLLIPATVVLQRYRDKKKTAVLLILFNSLFYVAIAVVPFVPDGVRIVLYLVMIGMMNGPASIYMATWQSLYSDNFKGSLAGRVFSFRGSLSTFFGLLTVLAAGYVLSTVPHSDLQRINIYQLFYLICFVITVLQALALSRLDTAKTAGAGRQVSNTAVSIREIVSNRPYVIYSLLALAFHLSWQVGWPIFFIYNVDYAKIGEFQLGLLNVASGVASFIFYPLWNKLVEKKGNSFTIIIATFGLALNPLFYTGVINIYLLIAVNAIEGASAAGFTLTLFLGLLKTLPEKNKTIYISAFNTLINVSGFAAPLIGIWLYGKMNIFMFFWMVFILRIIATSLYLIKWINEKKGSKSRIEPGTEADVNA